MKLKISIFIIVFILIFIVSINFSFAQTDVDINGEVDNIIDNIDITEIEKFYDSLANDKYTFGDSFKSIVKGIANGKVYDFDSFINLIVDSVNDAIIEQIYFFVFILAMLLLTAMTQSFSSISLDGTGTAASMLSYASISAAVLTVIVSSIESVTEVLDIITSFLNALFPVILTLTATLACVSTSGVVQSMGAVLSTTIINLISTVVLPLFGISMIFTMIGNLYGRIQLNNVSKLSKNIAEWLLGIVFSIFMLILGAQGIIGNTSDTIALKSTKFAMSSYVPILGGYLSDGFDIVLAGCIIVKNSVGFVGVIIILLIILYPTVKVVIISLLLKLLGAVAEPLGLNNISTMLYKSGENMRIIIAILLGVAFLIISLLVLIISLFNSGVV